jgi:hypothetical protein
MSGGTQQGALCVSDGSTAEGTTLHDDVRFAPRKPILNQTLPMSALCQQQTSLGK